MPGSIQRSSAKLPTLLGGAITIAIGSPKNDGPTPLVAMPGRALVLTL
jgi:hypothetical protein